jgi:hypothetical protein
MKAVSSDGKYHALIQGVVTRWTSTWLSCCSAIRAQLVLQLFFEKHRNEIDREPSTKTNEKLRRVAGICRSSLFWSKLISFMTQLIPSVESSLLLQSNSATLADMLYCYGRQCQALLASHEIPVLQKLEQRFAALEHPPMITWFALHPRYNIIAQSWVRAKVLTVAKIADWVESDAARWEVPGPGTKIDCMKYVQQWMFGTEGGKNWCKRAASFVDCLEDFWWGVKQGNSEISLQCLALVASKMFTVLPTPQIRKGFSVSWEES